MGKRSTTTTTTTPSPLDELASLLTLKDAAQKLHMSKDTLLRKYHAGEIPGAMFGGKLLFRVSDIEKYYVDSWHKGPEKRPYTKRTAHTKTRPHAKKSSAVAHERTPSES